ncbi:MAG: hypothetical protein EZS28_034335 [Streblomastix strix]|uniref:Uncharacterized protein n=1 Tax=Streblomastix strix TaxID=222440 RepID=A0A5J4UI60_9EUKA|nr:MAG: hypothetical protein EZS28_034335 [Streblomastix strix]
MRTPLKVGYQYAPISNSGQNPNSQFNPQNSIQVGYQSQQPIPLSYLPKQPSQPLQITKDEKDPNFQTSEQKINQIQIIQPSAPPQQDQRE